MLLSPVRTKDLETIISIENNSFSQPWKRQAIIDELACPDASQYVAKTTSNSAVIAYIFVRFLMDEMHVMKIAVAPQWRNRGAGSALLHAMQAEGRRRGAATVLLEVRPSNMAAIRLYEKAGFQTIGVRPDYYPKTRETALVMSKRLKEEP